MTVTFIRFVLSLIIELEELSINLLIGCLK